MTMVRKTLFLDVESTGLGDDAQIVELGIKDITGKVVYHGYFLPTVEPESEAVAVNGLDIAKLESLGAMDWFDHVNEIREVCNGALIVAYRAAFDKRLIEQTSIAFGVPCPTSNCIWNCAKEIYEKFRNDRDGLPLDKRWRLTDAFSDLCGSDGDLIAHTALGDVQMMVEVVKRLDSMGHWNGL